jgi:hypothetical protein
MRWARGNQASASAQDLIDFDDHDLFQEGFRGKTLKAIGGVVTMANTRVITHLFVIRLFSTFVESIDVQIGETFMACGVYRCIIGQRATALAEMNDGNAATSQIPGSGPGSQCHG